MAQIEAEPGALDGMLDAVMDEPAFYGRVREWTNDLLLTDRWATANIAVDRIDDWRDRVNNADVCDQPAIPTPCAASVRVKATDQAQSPGTLQ